MRIERIKPFLVDRCLLVRVYTDEGIIGTGEAGLWAHHPLVATAIERVERVYVGKDPSRIEHHFQVVSRDTHFQGAVLSAALSAIDVALWDILGKSLGKPVYQLLGGKVRDKIKGFANVVGATLDERIASAGENVEQGYTSLRTIPMFPGFEQKSASQVIADAVEIVRVIRETVGYGVDLGVEIHRNMTKPDVVVFANAVAEYRLLYLEDPLQPQSTGLAALSVGQYEYTHRGRRAFVQPVPVQGDHRHRRSRASAPGHLAGRWLHPGQEDHGVGRVGVHRRLPALDGQPGQPGSLRPA